MEEGVSIRRSIWISGLITIVVLAAFVGISAVIPRPADPSLLLLLGLILALIPAVVWMGFFNQQDRAEPEPKRLIARVFAFGALAAAAVAIPFASYVNSQTISQYHGLLPGLPIRFVLTVLSIALMQELLKVAMVRYVVLGTSEFDRHPDGIVYGLAAGLGFATVLSLEYIVRSGGAVPLSGAIRAVENALVHGALGAVSGYYIGRVKIDGKTVLWLASGLAIVTVINGAYQIAQDEFASQLAYNPWFDLAAAIVLALGVGSVLFALFRRAMLRAVGDLNTVSIQAHARAKEMPWDIALRYDWLLIGAALVALIVGMGAGQVARARTITHTGDDLPVQFSYPARWAVEPTDVGRFHIRNLASGGLFKPSITIDSQKVDEGAALDFLVAERGIVQERNYTFFTEIEQVDGPDIDGLPSIQVQYEYAAETDAGPSVHRGIETYVVVGDQFYIIRYEAEPDTFAPDLLDYQRLLQSVRFADAQ